MDAHPSDAHVFMTASNDQTVKVPALPPAAVAPATFVPSLLRHPLAPPFCAGLSLGSLGWPPEARGKRRREHGENSPFWQKYFDILTYRSSTGEYSLPCLLLTLRARALSLALHAPLSCLCASQPCGAVAHAMCAGRSGTRAK